MPTLSDHSTPIFSYVGRLRDSRKGLELFLDALSILWSSDLPKNFKAWVIGGSAEDKEWALSLAACRPPLGSRLSSGDLIFWGRIESNALAEFYSRSTALIVPSFREQFCITAVEAMMCGCPVIAARVGGLQDVVVDGRTGNLFDRGNSTSLVGVMVSYINTPALPRWLGVNAEVWARYFFDSQLIYAALENTLSDPTSDCQRWLTSPEIGFRTFAITQAIPMVERLLASEVVSFEDLTSSQSISFMVRLKTAPKVAFVKIYSDRPTLLSCLHETPFPGKSLQIPKERLISALHLGNQDFFPPVLAHDLGTGLIIQEWLHSERPSSLDEARHALKAASNQMQACDPAPETISIRNRIQEHLSQQQFASLELLEEIDRLTAELHAPLVGGNLRNRRIHPQLELFRIDRFLALNAFWLPTDYANRAQAVILFMLSARSIIPALPIFGHGSLKVEHLLSLKPMLCDFDHSGYFCGPVDLSHWIWDYFLHTQGSNPGAMLRLLREELDDATELYLGACWILAFQLNRDLVYLFRGDSSEARATMPFLYRFIEAFRAIQSIR